MEYDYQLLNPPPFSTHSINFKLTETQINSQNILTPVRAQESLTYTISLESLHESDFSPLKNHIPQPIEPSFQHNQQETKLEETQRVNDLKSFHEIQQIDLLQKDTKLFAQPKDRKQSYSSVNNEFEDLKLPKRKSILRIHNLEYQVVSTEESIVHNEDFKVRNRMGKILTKVHTVAKQNRTPFISRPTSLIKIVRNSHEKYERKHSIKSISKRMEDLEKQMNGESIYLKKRQKVSSSECNRKQKRQSSYDGQKNAGLKEMVWCDRATKNRFDNLGKNGCHQKLRYSNPEATYDKTEETLKNQTINQKRHKIFSAHHPNSDFHEVQNRSKSYLLKKKKGDACESNILMENKNSMKINKNSLLVESVKVNLCQRIGNANGQDQRKKYFSNKEGIGRTQKRSKQPEQIVFSKIDTQSIMFNNAQSGWRKLKNNFAKKVQ